MPSKRIFLTGSSGCVGHYLAETLIQETNHELFLLVRNPDKLKFDYTARPGIHILKADLRSIDHFESLLKTIEVAILTATAWGGAQEVYDTNVVKTLRLIELLDPNLCEQVIYFSTESILDHDNRPLKAAGELGTDYIQSKYICYQNLAKLTHAPPLTKLFPTLVFGGDDTKPYSHITAGLPDVTKYIKLIRFFKTDASFHFIHAQDIATVTAHLVENPPASKESRDFVLGNDRLSFNQAVEEACHYLNTKIYFRIPITLWIANLIIVLFRIQVSAWDRFCLNYRHFTHKTVVNPSTFGLSTAHPTLAHILKAAGIRSAYFHR